MTLKCLNPMSDIKVIHEEEANNAKEIRRKRAIVLAKTDALRLQLVGYLMTFRLPNATAKRLWLSEIKKSQTNCEAT